MASTGFWPVKSRLKDVISYAENLDKTTDKRFLDKDLWATIRYAENSEKTDRIMYVSGINCPKQRVYQCMMATKRRYGKLGGNVAYHGYQSFVSGEVTPEEAHKIGIETARKMWGDNYEIVVTTHLNTDNIHNHFVVNSVSFKTGRKFENHIFIKGCTTEDYTDLFGTAEYITGDNTDNSLTFNMYDSDECRESNNSIVNQKKYLESYCQQKGYTNLVHYTDDGWSGGNFERPAWKRLIADIEAGKVAHVIVKDMSRAGRDYLQTGFYTEVFFRQHGVHFAIGAFSFIPKGALTHHLVEASSISFAPS